MWPPSKKRSIGILTNLRLVTFAAGSPALPKISSSVGRSGISTEAARLNMGLVWAAILVAALAGSLLYGLLGWVERRATFWHPSIRTHV